MTRAEKRLYLTSARMRRRFGGSPPEPCIASRFLDEVPASLLETLHETPRPGDVDLFSERAAVREAVRRTTFTGTTYNSVSHIDQFFANRRAQAAPAVNAAPKTPPPAAPKTPPPAAPKPPQPPAPPRRTGLSAGATVYHAKYGRGTIIRKEGDGDEAKLTVSFHGAGLKKLIAKYAQLKTTP
jgi:DNA helicase II / ATP-dependent DNA helicase PcrA